MITLENYKEELKGINVVEVSGESCANCLTLMPILYNIVSRRNDAKLVHIEADEDTRDLLKHFEVRSVPAILIIKDGVLVDRAYGFQPEEILELWIDMKIKNC